MRLTLLDPPVLVGVVDATGTHPALLLATRGERRYVQVSRGAGLNHLRWVDAAAVGSLAELPGPQADTSTRTTTGLPWIRTRGDR